MSTGKIIAIRFCDVQARYFVIQVMPGILRDLRKANLRAQAKRKGRRGWRRIAILPTRMISRAQSKADETERPEYPFAPDPLHVELREKR